MGTVEWESRDWSDSSSCQHIVALKTTQAKVVLFSLSKLSLCPWSCHYEVPLERPQTAQPHWCPRFGLFILQSSIFWKSPKNDSVILEAVCLLSCSIQYCPIIWLLGNVTDTMSPLTFQFRRASKTISLHSLHVLEEETETQGLNRNFLWTTEDSLSALNRLGSYNSNSTKKVILRR